MQLQHFKPSDTLKPYVKYFWLLTPDQDMCYEVLYPSGFVELAIKITNGNVITHLGDRRIEMPPVEVLGHLTRPTRVSIDKGTVILIARFLPHASSLFFPSQISNFTNDSIDLQDILSKESTELYDQLMKKSSIEKKIQILDAFLVQRLVRNQRSLKTLKLIEEICNTTRPDGQLFNAEQLSARFGYSERYIQKLFLDWVGLSPKSFFSVQRFNKSLGLMRSSNVTLTSVAHECGYYDQAHFIREFKSFTGITPSQVVRTGS